MLICKEVGSNEGCKALKNYYLRTSAIFMVAVIKY